MAPLPFSLAAGMAAGQAQLGVFRPPGALAGSSESRNRNECSRHSGAELKGN